MLSLNIKHITFRTLPFPKVSFPYLNISASISSEIGKIFFANGTYDLFQETVWYHIEDWFIAFTKKKKLLSKIDGVCQNILFSLVQWA